MAPRSDQLSIGVLAGVLFDAPPSARQLPNLPQLEALDSYYVWRRSQSPHHH
jgi:hypothetical protein